MNVFNFKFVQAALQLRSWQLFSPLIAALFFVLMMLVFYNTQIFREDILNQNIKQSASSLNLSSASVIISSNQSKSLNKPIKNICVLSKNQVLSDNLAIQTALKGFQGYYQKPYQIDVVRPCQPQLQPKLKFRA